MLRGRWPERYSPGLGCPISEYREDAMQRCLILMNLLLLAGSPSVARAVEEPPPMARRATPVRGAELTGRWILTMPTGVQWHAAFERDGRSDHVRLRSG